MLHSVRGIGVGLQFNRYFVDLLYTTLPNKSSLSQQAQQAVGCNGNI